MPQMSKPPRPFNQTKRSVLLWAVQFSLLAGPLPASDLLPPGFRPLPLSVHALVGGKVVIKPGEVVPVEKVRGETNVSPRLVELLKARVDVQRPVLVGIGHAAAQQAAVRLRSLLQEQLRIAELLENEIGPAVGLHVGPGCVGAAILQPSEEELTLVTAP